MMSSLNWSALVRRFRILDMFAFWTAHTTTVDPSSRVMLTPPHPGLTLKTLSYGTRVLATRFRMYISLSRSSIYGTNDKSIMAIELRTANKANMADAVFNPLVASIANAIVSNNTIARTAPTRPPRDTLSRWLDVPFSDPSSKILELHQHSILLQLLPHMDFLKRIVFHT